jgi:hypothetical protein
MTAINETKCDQCGKQTTGGGLAGWRRVRTNLVVTGNEAVDFAARRDGLDFCSWECLHAHSHDVLARDAQTAEDPRKGTPE